MEHGDFTSLAKNYIHRPGYDHLLLNSIAKVIGIGDYTKAKIVDVGAGTGKLTEELSKIGFKNITSVEPNDSMREEGINYTKACNIKWISGSGESTNVESNFADWVLMGSSFHWTNTNKSLPEFSRILKEKGFFTAVWNPRDIESSELHKRIESKIYEIIPKSDRVSSGNSKFTNQLYEIMVSTGNFKNVFYLETKFNVLMTKERYLGAWNSVNDLRVQAGEEKWEKVIWTIGNEIKDLDNVLVPYKTRAWTAEKV